MDSDERVSDQNYHIELGWNTSPPRFQFPDSDRVDAEARDSSEDIPPPVPLQRSSTANHESLGKYSSLLPGSSPPRPRLKVRKRRSASPQQRTAKQARNGAEEAMLGEAVPGDQEAVPGDEEAVLGDEEAVLGDEEAQLGDEKARLGDEEARLGKKETTPEKEKPVLGEAVAGRGKAEALSGKVEAISGKADATPVPSPALSSAQLSRSGPGSQRRPETAPVAVAHEAAGNTLDSTAPAKPSKASGKPAKKPPTRSISDAELALLDDLDDDLDLEDMFAQTPVQFQPSFFSNRKVRRFTVQQVTQTPANVQVLCRNAQNELQTIELRGSWMNSVISRDDTLHLVSPKVSESLIVDPNAPGDEQVLLIINPDILIPCTTVAQAMSCERQVVLSSRVRAPSDLNENLVLGSIKHEFIQACFTAGVGGSFAVEVMRNELQRACDGYALDLRLVESDVESAFTKLQPIIPEIQKWAGKIWGRQSQGATVDSGGELPLKVRINRAIQIEEEIRSPYYGLVGKIDVTCEVALFGGTAPTTRLAGLEIKTGKFTQNVSHRAQTALYTLLMAERHPNNTHPWSLLYYTETGETSAVTLKHHELASLIQRRNAVARDMWYLPGQDLPLPVSASDMACKWCSRKDSCVLYTAIEDHGDTHQIAALSGIYEEAVKSGKLTPRFLEFIKHWNHLLDLEYDTSNKLDQLHARQWWLASTEPTMWKLGKKLDQENPIAVGHYYSLVPVSPTSAPSIDSLRDSTVLLSTKQHMALNFGIVTSASAQEIRVAVREELPSFGKYRIDIDPWASDAHLGLARFNLNNLMGADRLRELIVDLVPPQWFSFNRKALDSTIERASNRVLPTQPSSNAQPSPAKVASQHSNLNSDQSAALNKVLNARDYALILGMPGTGKTTTIAAIVASLVERGKTVLVSAYTNSAVDTIVRKLLDAQQKCLRLVSSNFDISTMSPDVAAVSVSMNGDASNARLVEFLSAPVVACTSHGTNNKIFALRQFDYCILDEASQITLPFVLGPLRLAPIFVLVGDHYQLPPLVRNQQARQLGMDQSLFKILSETHPDAVVALTKQYRMCNDIMSLSSELVYDGRLVAGNEEVGNQKLHIRGWSFINPKSPLYDALNPANRVVFLNTDELGAQAFEKKHDDGSSNPGEAKIIVNLATMLSDLGVDAGDCAVISVYRHQLALLTTLLQAQVKKGLEILTADQAQGRDKKCILVSLVKSNESGSAGELLKDWRRLNVAFTRAKQKLVIVGSKRTMQLADGVARFFNFIDSRGWVHKASLSS